MSSAARWRQTTLGAVATITTGGTPPTKDPSNYGCDVPFVKPGDLDRKFPITRTEQMLSRVGAAKARIVRKGAVLVSCIGNLGKVGIAGVPVATNQQINSVEFCDEVDDRFGYYYCRTLRPWMEAQASATTVTILNKSRFSSAPFVLPPIEEQRRIADKLDRLLAAVDTCKARLDAIPGILKRFRQSVLAAAVSGELTEEWRNTSAPRDRESHSSSKMERSQLPTGWSVLTLGELGELARGKSKHRPRNDPRLYGGMYPFIQTGDIARSSGKITSHSQTYNDFGLRQSRLFPAGTLCITIAANIAETALLTYPACFPDSVVGFIADPNLALTGYVRFFIDAHKDRLQQLAPATAQKNINLEILRAVKVHLPPVAEQHEVLRLVEILLARASAIEIATNAANVWLNMLVQRLLEKAFRGELCERDKSDVETPCVSGASCMDAADHVQAFRSERGLDSANSSHSARRRVM